MAYTQNPGRGPMQKTGRGIPDGFKQIVSETPDPPKEKLTMNQQYKANYEAYTANDDGTYSRNYEAANTPKRNRKESKKLAAYAHEQQQSGYNTESVYAGGKKGGWLSKEKTQFGSGASHKSYKNSETAEVSEKEIFRTLNKHGGASVVDGTITPKNTHTETSTITAKQYASMGTKVASNDALANKKAEHQKKQEIRRNDLIAERTASKQARATKKAEIEAAKAKRVADIIAAKKARQTELANKKKNKQKNK